MRVVIQRVKEAQVKVEGQTDRSNCPGHAGLFRCCPRRQPACAQIIWSRKLRNYAFLRMRKVR